MICKLKQTKSDLIKSEYYLIENEVIGRANTNQNLTYGPEIRINNSDGNELLLKYCDKLSFLNLFKFANEKMYNPYLITSLKNEPLGEIFCRDDGGHKLFSKYEYITVNYKGVTYIVYPIGLGKEGYKYPIYCNDVQVALIEKDCVVIDNLDEYDIFVKDNTMIDIVLLVSLYIDVVMFPNKGEQLKKGVTKSYSKSFNKELLSKYDANFKNGVF